MTNNTSIISKLVILAGCALLTSAASTVSKPYLADAAADETSAFDLKLTGAQPKDQSNKEELIDRARERGTVRIRVIYDMEYSRAREQSHAERQDQRSRITERHEQFTRELKSLF